MKLKPLSDHVIVQPLDEEQKTASGIIIPDSAKEKPRKGKVLEVGPGRTTEEGKHINMSVKKGDTILHTKYGPEEFKFDGKELLILQEKDIIAIIE